MLLVLVVQPVGLLVVEEEEEHLLPAQVVVLVDLILVLNPNQREKRNEKQLRKDKLHKQQCHSPKRSKSKMNLVMMMQMTETAQQMAFFPRLRLRVRRKMEN